MQNNHFKQCEEPTCSSGKALSSSRQTFKFPASMAQKMGALPLASRRMRTSLALCCSRVRTTWGARGFSYKFLLLAREKNIWHWLYPQGVYTWPDWPVWRELARYPQGVYTWPDWLVWRALARCTHKGSIPDRTGRCGEHWPGVRRSAPWVQQWGWGQPDDLAASWPYPRESTWRLNNTVHIFK